MNPVVATTVLWLLLSTALALLRLWFVVIGLRLFVWQGTSFMLTACAVAVAVVVVVVVVVVVAVAAAAVVVVVVEVAPLLARKPYPNALVRWRDEDVGVGPVLCLDRGRSGCICP